MNLHIEKVTETNVGKSDLEQIEDKPNPDFYFENNRADANEHQQWLAMASNSPRVKQLKSFQSIATDSIQDHSIRENKNNTGIPDNLKSGIESISGYAMDDVKVHYNSSKPSQLQAYAYAQGTDIHIAPGQEKHLPHEAWHVVQQKQQRVKPTIQQKGILINDNPVLEKEADKMGDKALKTSDYRPARELTKPGSAPGSEVVQGRFGFEFETGDNQNGSFVYYVDGGANRRFNDRDTVYTAASDLWKIVVDGGRMEFVTEAMKTLNQVQTIAAEILAFINAVQVAALGADIRQLVVGGTWAANYHYQRICVAKTAHFNQPVRASSFYGNPQVSLGVKGAKLNEFIDKITNANAVLPQLETEMVNFAQANVPPNQFQATRQAILNKHLGYLMGQAKAGNIRAKFPQVDTIVQNHVGALVPKEEEEFKGFLKYLMMQFHFLSDYVAKMHAGNANYMKSYFTVMPRTDFHSSYVRLSSDVKQAVQNSRADFVAQFPIANFQAVMGFTEDDLFQSVYQPRAQDTRSFGGKQRRVDRLSSAAGASGVQANHSLGALSKDSDDKMKLVHELRHVTGGLNIPFNIFVQHVMTPLMQWIGTINDE